MLRVLITLCLLSSFLVASESDLENKIEDLLKQSKVEIEKASTFEEKVSAIELLKANVIRLEQDLSIEGDKFDSDEYASIIYLTSAFESLDELQSYEYRELNGELGTVDPKLITRKNCSDALTRIHVDFDPQSEIPRLPNPVDSLYGMIQSVCSAID
ncbi:hypothetical protein A3752_12355 [Oleiphilus sp. HI0081]|nr:hypothetical protein A3743_06645 [Oleiphilus sp. HI0072]KZZ20219.1 hypothetical protein A3752_12355 [Oleiphilus sp. HI0081]